MELTFPVFKTAIRRLKPKERCAHFNSAEMKVGDSFLGRPERFREKIKTFSS